MHECALYSDPDLYDLLFPAIRDGAQVIDPARRERITWIENRIIGYSAQG